MREQSTQKGTRRALIAAAFAGLISAGTLVGVAGAQSADAPGVQVAALTNTPDD
jgi:hypothetical protein